jgi:hypothetical protein
MEATSSTEALVDFQRTIWRYIPEDRTLQLYFTLVLQGSTLVAHESIESGNVNSNCKVGNFDKRPLHCCMESCALSNISRRRLNQKRIDMYIWITWGAKNANRTLSIKPHANRQLGKLRSWNWFLGSALPCEDMNWITILRKFVSTVMNRQVIRQQGIPWPAV